jgi:hypothetical protein
MKVLFSGTLLFYLMDQVRKPIVTRLTDTAKLSVNPWPSMMYFMLQAVRSGNANSVITKACLINEVYVQYISSNTLCQDTVILLYNT